MVAHFLFVVILDRETKKKVKLASIPIIYNVRAREKITFFCTKMQINLVISIKSSNFAGHFGVKRRIDNKNHQKTRIKQRIK